MKKVLHLLASDKYGGAESIAIDIIQSLKDQYEFAYASPAGLIDKTLFKVGIKHVVLDYHHLVSFVRAVKMFEPEIIHAHDFKSSFLAHLLFRKIPIILHIHQAPEWQMTTNWKSRCFRYIANRSFKVIYVSDWARASYIYQDKVKKACVIKNGLKLSQIHELALRSNVKSYDVLFVGRLEHVKQPEVFLKIVKKVLKSHPHLKIGILGEGSEFAVISEKTQHDQQIDVLGFKDNPYPYMLHSKVILSTSVSDAFGLTMVEAAFLGAIPVAPNVGGIADTAQGVGGLIYHSQKEAVEILNRLFNDQKYLDERLSRLSTINFDFYDERRYMGDIRKVYKEVLRNG
ncbi:glycosyltransferase [Lactiplantibacillus modestisalitolerans]|uniref:Glycosyltransferase n=1 Tax=Lactiplantibacillus modestisalitolerans TaxID=1457219 RepID=A0ABV5WV21_9LACO|nr:glycosyltransferase [Lactiplantibacillus modestisalitolerans]